MNQMRYALLFLIFSLSLPLSGQDIHYTQFQLSPMVVNPAFTGDFHGTFRIGGIYRDQWSSFLQNQYTTPSFYIDAPLIKGFGKYDWLGVGISFFADQAGEFEMQRSSFQGSVAYHLALDNKRNTVVTLGAQVGNTQLKINMFDALNLEDKFSMSSFGFTGSSSESFLGGNMDGPQTSFLDVNGGLLLTSRLNDQMDFNLGFSMFHINQPQYGINRSQEKMPQRMVLHGQYNVQMTDKWSLSPSFFYQNMASNSEIAIQAVAGLMINEEENIKLKFGPGYRMRDAAEIIVGIEYGDLVGGISYDVNISDLNEVSNFKGGFEIGVAYIAKIYKDPQPDEIIFCPRL